MLDVFRPIFSWDYTKKYWLAGVILIAMLCLSPIFHAYFNGNLIFKSDGGAWAIASNLVGGKGYSGCATDYFPNCESTSQATAMREPIPVLLIALARLFHPTKLSALIMQSLYYLGSIPAIYLTLKESSRNVKTALLGTLMWTFSVPVINQVDNGSGDLAAAFFFSFGMYFFLRGYHASKAKDWVISGLFFGLAALSRTVLLGVGIGLGAVMLAKKWFETRPFSKKQIGGILLFLVSLFLVFSPWVIRNTLVFGQPVIGSSLTGYNIYRMNFIVANADFQPHYVGAKEGYAAVRDLLSHSTLTGLENEAQLQSIYMKAGLQLITQHPIEYLQLALYRFLPLWFNVSVNEAYGTGYYMADYLSYVQQFLFLLAVLFGISKHWRSMWPFILALVLGCGAYMAIDAQMRYLVDLMPAVVILSAAGLGSLMPQNEMKINRSLDGLA